MESVASNPKTSPQKWALRSLSPLFSEGGKVKLSRKGLG